jgi:hypothetical protein
MIELRLLTVTTRKPGILLRGQENNKLECNTS